MRGYRRWNYVMLAVFCGNMLINVSDYMPVLCPFTYMYMYMKRRKEKFSYCSLVFGSCEKDGNLLDEPVIVSSDSRIRPKKKKRKRKKNWIWRLAA